MEWCELTILAGASSLSDVSNVITSMYSRWWPPHFLMQPCLYWALHYFANEIKGLYVWSLELPWSPWAGPHTVQGGAGCGWRLPTNYPQWWQVPDLDFRQIIKNISEKSDHPFAPDDQMSEGEDCCAHLYRVLCLMLVRFLLCFCTHNITLKKSGS